MSADITLLVRRGQRAAMLPRPPRLNGGPRRRLVALVDTAAESMDHQGFAFPVVEFATVDDDAAEPNRIGVSVRFQRDDQRHRIGTLPRKGLRGFMGGYGASRQWTPCYAPELRASLDRFDAMHVMTSIAKLLERAKQATHDHAPRALRALDCDLLTLIDGLRRIGVEIRITSKAARAHREARRRGPEYSIAMGGAS